MNEMFFHRRAAKTRRALSGGVLIASTLLLNACAYVPWLRTKPVVVDCTQPSASCHEGRFNAVWTSLQTDPPQRDAANGRYSWQSGPKLKDDAFTRLLSGPVNWSELELTSSLGPTLARATSDGKRFTVKLSDGQTFDADNWQSLFDKMFPQGLPAQALVSWFEHPGQTAPPNLSEGWQWSVSGRRIRLSFDNGELAGRIDLLPDSPP